MKRYGRSWSFKLIRDEIENPCEISYLSVNQLYAYLLYRLTICWSKVLFFFLAILPIQSCLYSSRGTGCMTVVLSHLGYLVVLL